MLNAQKIGLFILMIGIHQMASAESFFKKSDLEGQWNLKIAACTRGKHLDQIKNATLNYDGKHLSLSLKDEKTMKNESIIDTDHFVIQEDLLTFTKNSNESATIKVQKKSKTVLLLKFPTAGLPGDCPEEDLAVWTFQRAK